MEPPVVEDKSSDHGEDRVEIAALISGIEQGFNTNDADLLVSQMAANVSFVGVSGVRTTSRIAIHAAMATGLKGPLSEQFAAYELIDIMFPRPDVAVAHTYARAVDGQGRRRDVEHAMVSLYILVENGGCWWLLARQDTMVSLASPAQGPVLSSR